MTATEQGTAVHLPVLDLPTGRAATLTASPLPGQVARRLAELGLRPGVTFRVLSRSSGGGRVLSVQGARIALDRATSRALQARLLP